MIVALGQAPRRREFASIRPSATQACYPFAEKLSEASLQATSSRNYQFIQRKKARYRMEEIRFTITPGDYWHYQCYVWLHLRILRLIALFLVLIGSFCFFSFFQGSFFALLFVVGLVGFIVLRTWGSVSQATKVFKERGVNLITISEQGIRQKHELGDGTTSWRAIKAIREDKHNLYFILEVAGSRAIIMALLLPRQAFASPQEATSFLERARGYWRQQCGQIGTAVP